MIEPWIPGADEWSIPEPAGTVVDLLLDDGDVILGVVLGAANKLVTTQSGRLLMFADGPDDRRPFWTDVVAYRKSRPDAREARIAQFRELLKTEPEKEMA